MAYYVTTTTVCVFPGLGKEILAAKFPTMARYMKSADYRTDSAWPTNLVEQLKALDKSGMYRRVFTDITAELRKAMTDAGLKYTIIVPSDDPKLKRVIMDRLKERKWTEAQLKDMEEHYSDYINELVNDTNASRILQLTMETLNAWDGYVLME